MVEINNKFEIDIEKEQLGYYVGSTKMLVDDDMKGDGQYNYQKGFQLDKEHKDHWINYAVKYSGNKVGVDFGYKKRIGEDRHINYKKRIEKLANNIIVEFDYLDEYIKITDASQLEGKFKEKGYKWVNKVQGDQQHRI